MRNSLRPALTAGGGPCEGQGLGRGLAVQSWRVSQNRAQARICRLRRAFQKLLGLAADSAHQQGLPSRGCRKGWGLCSVPTPHSETKGRGSLPSRPGQGPDLERLWRERLLGSAPAWGHRIRSLDLQSRPLSATPSVGEDAHGGMRGARVVESLGPSDPGPETPAAPPPTQESGPPRGCPWAGPRESAKASGEAYPHPTTCHCGEVS